MTRVAQRRGSPLTVGTTAELLRPLGGRVADSHRWWVLLAVTWQLVAVPFAARAAEAGLPIVTFSSLLQEMTNRAAVTHWPEPAYRSLQASSYHRASKTPDDPAGWFANGDQGFALRTETNGARTEAVLMEHEGPGVLTRIWTPFFYRDFNDRKGTDLRIYIDGETTPRIVTNLIALVLGQALVPPPFGQPTCRAGDLYLPIPFQKSCKVTQENAAFFYIINYRAYDTGTPVESFRPEMLQEVRALLEATGNELKNPSEFQGGTHVVLRQELAPQSSKSLELPRGPAAVRQLQLRVSADNLPQALRSTVLEFVFDGESTVWCPVGDFFSNVNGIDPYRMWERDVQPDGTMVCRWILPYSGSGILRLHNLASAPVSVELSARTSDWEWKDDSLLFYTTWWTAPPKPPRPVRDLNFVEVQGRGIHVGDTLVVLNPLWSWWGEGDEKIFVDDDIERRFPSHFGTGSEDYYGWAGGEVPTRRDEFSTPFLANVRVGGQTRDWPAGKEPYTHGYNICTRTRSLDATPFTRQFKFDMEAFNMIDTPDAYLQYSLVTHWYGAPGARHNRPPLTDAAAAPVPQTEDVARAARQGSAAEGNHSNDLVEFENIQEVTMGMKGGTQHIGDALPPHKWSGGSQFLGRATNAGEWVEFVLPEQSHPKRLLLYPSKSYDYGTVSFHVNGRLALEDWDGYAESSHPDQAIDLGVHAPLDGCFRLKVVVRGKSPKSAGYFVGLDAIALRDIEETGGVAAEITHFLRSEVFDERPRREWPQLVGLTKRPWGTAAVALIWNPGTSDQSTTLDFAGAGLDPEGEYAIWSYRDSRFLGYAKGSWSTPVLPALGSLHLRVSPVSRSSRSLPALIGSSLHPYCGAAEVKAFQPGRNDVQIDLTDAGAPEGSIYIYSPLGLSRKSAQGCKVESVEQTAEDIWKISLAGREPGVPQRVVLRVALPLLQRPAFWLVLGVALTSAVSFTWWSVQHQRARIELVRLEQQNALERERGRIARDIHDDLGANLAEIAMLSELAQDELPPDHPARATLNEIFTRAEKNVRRLGDIVWAINPGSDTLEQFSSHLCRFAQEYLEMAKVRCRLDLPETLPPATLDSVQRHNLFSAAKEAVHNAVHHGGPSEVILRITASSGCVVVTIEDNGRGFDESTRQGNGHGTTNMRTRMEQLGGRYHRQSAPGRGTVVTLTLPVTLPQLPHE